VELELDERGELLSHGCCHCRDAGRIGHGLARSEPGFGKTETCPQCIGAVRGAAVASAPSGEFEGQRSRVPMILSGATLDNWLPSSAGPVATVRSWVQRWPPERHVMMISGLPGRGKSHLAVAAMRALWTLHGRRSRFWLVPEMIERFRQTVPDSRRETLQEVHEEFAKTALLVLDDLGTEKGTDWGYEQLFKVLDRRYREGLPMLITTNLKSSELDARLLSRLTDRTYAVVVDIDPVRYPDHRAVKA